MKNEIKSTSEILYSFQDNIIEHGVYPDGTPRSHLECNLLDCQKLFDVPIKGINANQIDPEFTKKYIKEINIIIHDMSKIRSYIKQETYRQLEEINWYVYKSEKLKKTEKDGKEIAEIYFEYLWFCSEECYKVYIGRTGKEIDKLPVPTVDKSLLKNTKEININSDDFYF